MTEGAGRELECQFPDVGLAGVLSMTGTRAAEI